MNELCKGAIFDLDGVVTASAKLHREAWKKTFDDFLEKFSKVNGLILEPFSYELDYPNYVDGKPRYEGVKSFLESRNINIPFGHPDDSPDKETICGIGNKKNELLHTLIREKGVEVFGSTIELINILKQQNIKVGLATSSKNSSLILENAGLENLFETIVDGVVSEQLGLKGKPNPDIFVTAAHQLGLYPTECMIFEDAISGVEAGKNGNFALVVGVARRTAPELLKENGADIVVKDLSELTWEQIEDWFANGINEKAWHLIYYKYDKNEEMLRESLTTTGNGYFATRGAFVGSRMQVDEHYPGTYIAGLYNRLPSQVHDRTIYNNDLVNCPNWLLVELKIGDGDFFNPLDCEILKYKHDLNMLNGIVTREITFKDQNDRITNLKTENFISMDDMHVGAVKYQFTPQNYSSDIVIRSSIDGSVINYGVARYRDLSNKHLEVIDAATMNGYIYLYSQTNRSFVKILIAAKHKLLENDKILDLQSDVNIHDEIISEYFKLEAGQGVTYTLEKYVTLFTSKDKDRDTVDEDIFKISFKTIRKLKSYEKLLDKHIKAWQKLWEEKDYVIEGDRFSQLAVRLYSYHLLVTANIFNKYIDTGAPARGWHGEAYRGHIFWDEIFIFPFFNIWNPEITKNLLMYRYRRLDAALRYARDNGYEGAMYPWQSADTGDEETQELHYNPISGKWDPDLSRLQRHVSLAISYNIWVYFYVTRDLDFLHNYGIEMMLEIARFFSSIIEYNKVDGRYHIYGVMGPDEFHEKYPNAEKGGIDDNAYTNIMTAWIMHKTIETYEYLPKKEKDRLKRKIGFKEEEIALWKEIVSKLYVEITDEGIISQFAGYMNLKELNWQHYKDKYGNIGRMDRILKAEGDSPDNYKLSKQADVLMIYYFLSPGQLKHILELMGYHIGDELEFMRKNYNYYIQRTSHGSTLSFVVHSAILIYLKDSYDDMWNWFLTALKSDIYDLQGGTTREGIHAGLMGGTLDIIFKSFAGINLFKNRFRIDPVLPKHWKKLSFNFCHRHNWFNIEITQNTILIKGKTLKDGDRVAVEYKNKRYQLYKDQFVFIKHK